MRITMVHPDKRQWVEVHFDGAEPLLLDAKIWRKSGLSTGCDIDSSALDSLVAASQYRRAFDHALRLLSRRDYGSSELAEALTIGENQSAARAAADKMVELRYVDDSAYARRLAADCLERRRYSVLRTRCFLRHKGLSSEDIEEAIDLTCAGFGGEEQTARTAALVRLRKKRYSETSDPDQRRKMTESLLRQGFRYADIQAAIDALTGEDRKG